MTLCDNRLLLSFISVRRDVRIDFWSHCDYAHQRSSRIFSFRTVQVNTTLSLIQCRTTNGANLLLFLKELNDTCSIWVHCNRNEIEIRNIRSSQHLFRSDFVRTFFLRRTWTNLFATLNLSFWIRKRLQCTERIVYYAHILAVWVCRSYVPPMYIPFFSPAFQELNIIRIIKIFLHK